MNSRTKGLLIFAFGGVIIAGIIMGIFDVPAVKDGGFYQDGARIYALIGTFIGLLFVGYGFTLLRENQTN
jgi:hypothetical protein